MFRLNKISLDKSLYYQCSVVSIFAKHLRILLIYAPKQFMINRQTFDAIAAALSNINDNRQ